MNTPLAALTWEIWRRGRRSALLALGCVTACVLVNFLILDGLHLNEDRRAAFYPFFGMLMVFSFLFLMGVFNYTEFNSTREWNGFPYRLFVLPLPTWQLVTLPMLLALVSVEAVYFAWIKLVWTHQEIVMTGWFAVVLGAYTVFYQTVLWCLAGLRIIRVVALGLGGVSSVAVACMPVFSAVFHSPWLSQSRLIPLLLWLAIIGFLSAWITVARQRCGGGYRRLWLKALLNRIIDILPRRSTDFASPSAAQYWYEWRRTGWLMPACTALAILAIIAPASWIGRHNPRFADFVLARLIAVPFLLAFVIGKGFVKCEFWSTQLSVPPFLAVRPLSAGQFVIAKMKVAALSVLLSWAMVLAFIGMWFSLWADTTDLSQNLVELRTFCPHSWLVIIIGSVAGLMVLTWRCLVSGLWNGLSGKPSCYYGSVALQLIVPALVMLAVAIWSDSIDRLIDKHPDLVKTVALRVISWTLATLVIAKLWFAAVSWGNISKVHTRQYLLVWLGATLCFIALGMLITPPLDVYRLKYIYLLAAFLIFPLARVGLAPASLERNRHH